MLANTCLNASEALRIGRRQASIVTNVNVDQCSTCFVRFVGRLHLLADRQRNRGVVRFVRK